MGRSEINRLSAVEVARKIAQRKLSAYETVEASLARLKETEAVLNAFTYVDAEAALNAARAADDATAQGARLGLLHGVPISVKDMIDVAGMPSSYGSRTSAGYVPVHDAPSVARLRAAGAIIIGKTTTSELGYLAQTRSLVHGVTRNPWNPALTPGGSSGGAAASVAAGVTPIALATDGAGSTRIPASLTGLVGIKANFGRVPVWPASATPGIAHVGPIARTVDDAALVLDICAGADRRDAFSFLSPSPVASGELKRLRLAYAPTLGYAAVQPQVAHVVAQAVAKLADAFLGIELVDTVCEDEGELLTAVFIGGLSARLAPHIERTPTDIDPRLLTEILAFRQKGAGQFADLLQRWSAHRERLWRFFERYDALLTPTTPVAAWSADLASPPGHDTPLRWSYFTFPFNLSGQPAASIPCGFTSDGLPVGLQIVVPIAQEASLLALLRMAAMVLGSVEPPEDNPIVGSFPRVTRSVE